MEVELEPEHEVVLEEAASTSNLPRLMLSVSCQYAQAECETSVLNFRPTMMFQTRSHTFELKNPGEVALRFRWRLDEEAVSDATPPAEIPFWVTPMAGSVPPGSTQEITISFSPQE
eukprot:6115201-Pleurochrysis_carterae.AAC.1